MICLKCNASNIESNKFCGSCGASLAAEPLPAPEPEDYKGERKHATVMFSDLSGYTAMTENMDPEEVKTLMGDIFKKAERVVKKYSGTVERFFGDEVMILFGVPKAHEDDPVRAIHAASEIHKLVDDLSPAFEKAHQAPLKMHTGINTGLVITGDEYIGKGRHGLTGDTINLAKRLTSLAAPGQIIVGPDTFRQSRHRFEFEPMDTVPIKGKQNPVQIFSFTGSKRDDKKNVSLTGRRSVLIGRSSELALMRRCLNDLKQQKGTVLALCGKAGTGKTRLVDEFKDGIDQDRFSWVESHSFPYTRNIPYYPLIHLLNHAFRIKEGDTPDIIREKFSTGLDTLDLDTSEILPTLLRLYEISHAGSSDISPEFWRDRLYDAIFNILQAQAERFPTILCLEDLHWADPSFLELIARILSHLDAGLFIICMYRPQIDLFEDHLQMQIKLPKEKITLQELSESESRGMVESLLRSNEIPQGLTRFMDTKTEGNPFYLEEMINSLVESGVLKQINDTWTLTREISSNDISATIHGLIAARLDRLKSTSKRVLQEASIIGRSFYHDIIRQISDITENMNECLGHLQSSDLIITHCLDPDIEYIFKHALTQEVVYNSVLLKERQQIHEKVGNVMEDLFKDRLPEFYESLAHHFSLGKSKIKAVDYLIKAAEKSMNRFSLQESHDFFSKAYEIILELPENQAGVDDIIVTLLNKWGFLFYYRGDFKSGLNIFSKHIKNIEKISDKEKIGMFYALYGYILFNSWKGEQGHEYLIKAKQIGHEIGNFEIVGYACAWLTFVYADAGRFKEGIEHGEAGLKLAKKNHLDHYVYYKCIGGLCYINVWIGDAAGSIEYGEHLIDYCEKHGQSRGLAIGYSFCKGAGEFCAGDFLTSIKSVEKAVAVSVDPLHNLASRHYLATVQLFLKRWEKGRQICGELVPLYESSGAHQINQGARLLLGLALAGIGELSKGEKLVLDALNDFETPFSLGKRPFHILAYAKLYYEIILGDTKPTLSVVMNNLGFILKNIPFAFKKAIYLYEKSISLSKKLDAYGIEAMAHLDLAKLYRHKKNPSKAKDHIQQAIPLFERSGAYVFLKQARELLEDLK